MEYKLWENGAPGYNAEYGQAEPALTFYPADDGIGRGCVIVAPGGGYSHLAPHEGEPIAKMLNAGGINAFVLRYRLKPYVHPAMLDDAQRAVRFVRYNAAKFGVNPRKIGMLGFSAGGHLTATAVTLFDDGKKEGDEIDRVSCRPDAGVLCYAVTSLDDPVYGHVGLACNLLGKGREGFMELSALLSPVKQVRGDTPPVFLWHTSEDSVVDVRNAYSMASALREKNIPCELHVFPKGRHGLGLVPDDPHAAKWSALCIEWLAELGF